MDENWKDYLVQESYYGKLPEFEQIEDLLRSVIEKVKKDPKKSNPNKFPEMKKIQKLFTKVFGFKKSIIYWEPFSNENAYTYSLNTFVILANKGKDYIKKGDRGFYDTSHTSVLTVYLSVGLILTSKLNEKQILACILHEIGHNFDFSGYHLIGYYLQNILTLGLNYIQYSEFEDMDDVNDYKNKINKKIQKTDDEYYNKSKKRQKENKRIIEILKRSEKMNAIFSVVSLIGNMLNAPIFILFSPIIQLTSLGGKKGELFADSFATAYGYGTDLINGLDILSNTKKYYDPKSKVMSFLQDLGNFQTEVYIAFNDIHGSNQERCMECKKKLVQDLKRNDFSPELKEELQKEIDKIDTLYKTLINFSPNEKSKITKIWRKINHFIFRGNPMILQKLFKTNRV